MDTETKLFNMKIPLAIHRTIKSWCAIKGVEMQELTKEALHDYIVKHNIPCDPSGLVDRHPSGMDLSTEEKDIWMDMLAWEKQSADLLGKKYFETDVKERFEVFKKRWRKETEDFEKEYKEYVTKHG